MSARPLRVGFDATACLGERTGIGRYTAEVLAGLGGREEIELRVFAVSWQGRDRLGTVAPPGASVVRRPMAARPLHALWSRLDRPVIEWWTGEVDVVHGPNYVVPPSRGAVRIVTVHDLTPIRFPELADEHTRSFPPLIGRAIREGAWVHTSSEFVAAEVVETFGAEPERVVSIPGGVTPLPADAPGCDAATGHRLVGSGHYVLALGTIEPRKDLPALVDAFDRLAGSDSRVHLALAGAEGWGATSLDAAIARARHRDRVVRLGRVSETDRAALLRGALVLAYPSRYEGFGLPPVEAMDAGVPVVCTDAGSLPEVVGDAAILVSAARLDQDRAQGISDLADALAAVIGDRELREDLVVKGRARAARFDWKASASAFVELYQRAAQR